MDHCSFKILVVFCILFFSWCTKHMCREFLATILNILPSLKSYVRIYFNVCWIIFWTPHEHWLEMTYCILASQRNIMHGTDVCFCSKSAVQGSVASVLNVDSGKVLSWCLHWGKALLFHPAQVLYASATHSSAQHRRISGVPFITYLTLMGNKLIWCLPCILWYSLDFNKVSAYRCSLITY